MEMENLAGQSVLLHITHCNLKNFACDISFSLQITVESIKDKLWRKCGTTASSMSLVLCDNAGNKLSDLTDDWRPLGFFSPQDGYGLHVIDHDPYSVTSDGWLEDTSLVEKYSISEEAYDKRDGTFRKFKEKLALQDSLPFQQPKIADNYMEDLCRGIKYASDKAIEPTMQYWASMSLVGNRCEVEQSKKRGVVTYVGPAQSLAPGFWVGIQFDEPLGKHDGMVKGVRYFRCTPLHGVMVRPDKVKIGDYPERGLFNDDDEEI